MSHTKGKLFVLDLREVGEEQLTITNGKIKGGVICRIANTVRQSPLDDEDAANARRLVACWNACDGIETEKLEAAEDWAAAGVATAESLRRERDELVKALRRQYNADAELYCGAHNIDKEDYETLLSEHDASHSAIAAILARYQEGK